MQKLVKVLSIFAVCLLLCGVVAGPAQAVTALQPTLEQGLAQAFGYKWGVLEYTPVKELPSGYTLAGTALVGFWTNVVGEEGLNFLAAPIVATDDNKAYIMIPLPRSNERFGWAVVKTETPSWECDFARKIQVKMAHKDDPDAVIMLEAALVPLKDLKAINHSYLYPLTVYEMPKSVNWSNGIY
ncbi:hypothetical protein [Syntrophothermus lipocalidus]|uniref:Uncharacterized protein n=1 Tax=Syntrophothermus lipocalidus (strain DSM 12680 / TGB-C1) TaxID=643648 RepID=D7CQ04_SYNLT|nr:hypothetical protein [Syntrophothermus lipocalidus]ADI02782.1 hypothetical protein Slip_2035 [Syntrophothermus lipocalidus DSM 12680]